MSGSTELRWQLTEADRESEAPKVYVEGPCEHTTVRCPPAA
ncbi:hypothetical protein ACH4EC_11625 [Streptomyces anulatus]